MASSGTEEKDASSSKPEEPTQDDENSIELIRRYLATKLGFTDETSEEKSKPEKEKVVEKVIPELSLDGIVKFIQDGHAKKIVTMAGAGISTSAGIPDFRSPGSGLYDNLAKYNLPDPQAVFEINFFKSNPQPFFTLAKELFPGAYKPTVCHYFIKLLDEKGYLLRHYTQNIDTLERVAGLTDNSLVEAHGTYHTSHCLDCKLEYDVEWMRDKIFADVVPTCTECNGIVKPDIVFFGENLPSKFFSCSKRDFLEADLLIILGSSLVVQPFASLVDRVRDSCPRLLINREKAGESNRLMKMLGMGGGLDFDSDDNIRDVAWLGDCDEGCKLLAEKLGWLEDLNKLVKEGHDKIDKAHPAKDTKKTPDKCDSSSDK